MAGGLCSVQRLAVVILLLGLIGCGRSNHSGEYLASTATTVVRLQIVETADKHLSGQMEVSNMNPEGQIHYIDWSVGGVADGSDISLNLKPTSLLLGVVNVSGSLSGNKLTLTGGISGTSSDSYVLYRSSLDQYRTALAALKRQSAATIKQRREAAVKAVIAATAEAMREKVQRDQEAFAADVHKLCDGMDKFTVAGRAMIQTIPQIAARYRGITAKMRN